MNEKIIRIQSELKANKSQFNKFGNYSYRSCEDILEAVKPLLSREGLLMTITDEVINILDRVYVMAHVTVTDGTNKIETSALAREALSQKGMSDSQITGSASSYARKYALSGLFLIDDNKDDDTRDNKTEQVKKAFKAKEVENTFDKEKAITEIEKAMDIMKYSEQQRESMRSEYNLIESKGGFVELYKLVMGGK